MVIVLNRLILNIYLFLPIKYENTRERDITMKFELIFEPAKEMLNDSIYVDGAVRGTIIDVENNSFSFDHHVEPRFAQSSSAFQVAMAILQGLDVSTIKNVFVSSIDADSILSVATIRNPSWVNNIQFIKLLQDLSRIDNHGPSAVVPGEAIAGYHYAFRSARGVEETTDVLMLLVERAEEMYIDGRLFKDGNIQKFPGIAMALNRNLKIVNRVDGNVSFDDVYSFSGFGILFGENNRVTIGKKPFFPIKSLSTLWTHLSTFEKDDKKWGGADSIGGSPMGSGTSQTQVQVIARVREWAKM